MNNSQYIVSCDCDSSVNTDAASCSEILFTSGVNLNCGKVLLIPQLIP